MSARTCEILHPTGQHNFSIVEIGNGKLWLAFSYSTPIGFFSMGMGGCAISKNEWGPTTGKHINYLKAHYLHKQLERDEFETELSKLISRVNITSAGVEDPFEGL